MANILGVIGSPRNGGNTEILVRKILEGAVSAGVETGFIHLSGLSILECNGCHACWRTGQCAKNDDMIELYPQIIQSDVIIFGTPVYWYGPTALMKGFIDRFVYFNSPTNRLKIKGKGAVLAVPYEENSPDTAAPLIAFFEKSLNYLEVHLIAKLTVPGVTLKGEVLNQKEKIEEAYQLGKSLAIDLMNYKKI